MNSESSPTDLNKSKETATLVAPKKGADKENKEAVADFVNEGNPTVRKPTSHKDSGSGKSIKNLDQYEK